MGKLREPSDGEIRRVVFVDIVFDDRDLVVAVDLFVFFAIDMGEQLRDERADHIFVIGKLIHVFVADLLYVGQYGGVGVLVGAVFYVQTARIVQIESEGDEIRLFFMAFVMDGIRPENRVAVVSEAKGFRAAHILAVQIADDFIRDGRIFVRVFHVHSFALRFVIIYEFVAIVNVRTNLQFFALIFSDKQIFEFNHFAPLLQK